MPLCAYGDTDINNDAQTTRAWLDQLRRRHPALIEKPWYGIDVITYLNLLTNQGADHCDAVMMPGAAFDKLRYLGFCDLEELGSNLLDGFVSWVVTADPAAQCVRSAIEYGLQLAKQGGHIDRIQRGWRVHGQCTTSTQLLETPPRLSSSSSKITLTEMSGVIVLYCIVLVSAILLKRYGTELNLLSSYGAKQAMDLQLQQAMESRIQLMEARLQAALQEKTDPSALLQAPAMLQHVLQGSDTSAILQAPAMQQDVLQGSGLSSPTPIHDATMETEANEESRRV